MRSPFVLKLTPLALHSIPLTAPVPEFIDFPSSSSFTNQVFNDGSESITATTRSLSTFDITSPSSSSPFGDNSMCARRHNGQTGWWGWLAQGQEGERCLGTMHDPCRERAVRAHPLSMTSSARRLMVVLWSTFKQDRQGRRAQTNWPASRRMTNARIHRLSRM
jgi:hypothetical protein